jgi:hypothetical protein
MTPIERVRQAAIEPQRGAQHGVGVPGWQFNHFMISLIGTATPPRA